MRIAAHVTVWCTKGCVCRQHVPRNFLYSTVCVFLCSGDVAVVKQNSYIKVTDRSKDVITSSGQNISIIEVQDVVRRSFYVNAATPLKYVGCSRFASFRATDGRHRNASREMG